jgi:pantetheine-phosphate adenylyltransferase
MKLLDLALTGVSNVRIEAFAGRLLVDVCREAGAQAIVKGLRSDTDFAYELPMALMNRHLSGVETVFLPGDPRFGHVSSSLIKDVAAFGGDITGLVPDDVRLALLDRLQNSEGS